MSTRDYYGRYKPVTPFAQRRHNRLRDIYHAYPDGVPWGNIAEEPCRHFLADVNWGWKIGYIAGCGVPIRHWTDRAREGFATIPDPRLDNNT